MVHVLNLDDSVAEEVMLLNRNCMRLLGISDFDGKARYQEPTKKIILNDIVCRSCSNVIDVDVFRDKMFQERNYDCPSCSHKFDEVIS